MLDLATRFLLAAVLACGLATTAVAGRPADPVMRPPVERLSPTLLRAKAELRGIVARRDMEALLTRVRPETTLDFGGSEGPPPDWARVRLADGTAGYIHRCWVRSPIDFRFVLRVDDGADAWWLGFLLAGD